MAVNDFFLRLAPSVVSSELRIYAGHCMMTTSCTILVEKPVHVETQQLLDDDVDPNVTVRLSNFRAAVPAMHNNISRRNEHAVTKGAGTPRFALKEAFPNAEGGKQWPTKHEQSTVSL